MIASPAATKLAKSKGIKLDTITGTGNFGRITPDDVLRAAGEAPTSSTASKLQDGGMMVGTKVATSAPGAPAPAPGSGGGSPAPSSPMPSGVTPMTAMQKAVVKNMNWSNDVPTYQVSRAITTDKLDALYAQLKPKGVTVSALLAKAVGMTLAKHPIMNAAYVEDGIKYNENIDIAMAVALPEGGLVTPKMA